MTSIPKELEKTARFYDILFSITEENKEELIKIIREENKLYDFLLNYRECGKSNVKNIRLLNEVINKFKDQIFDQNLKEIDIYNKTIFESPLIVDDKYNIRNMLKAYPKIFENDTIEEYYRITKNKKEEKMKTKIYIRCERIEHYDYFYIENYIDYCIYYDYYNIFKKLFLDNTISKISVYCAILGNHSHSIEMIRLIQQKYHHIFEDKENLKSFIKMTIKMHNKELYEWFTQIGDINYKDITSLSHKTNDRENLEIDFKEISLFPEILEEYRKKYYRVSDLVIFLYLTQDEESKLLKTIRRYFDSPFSANYTYKDMSHMNNVLTYCFKTLSSSMERYKLREICIKNNNLISYSIQSIVTNYLNRFCYDYNIEFLLYEYHMLLKSKDKYSWSDLKRYINKLSKKNSIYNEYDRRYKKIIQIRNLIESNESFRKEIKEEDNKKETELIKQYYDDDSIEFKIIDL